MRHILFLVSFTIVTFSDAQILDKIKDKTKNAATTKATDFNTSRSNKERNLNSTGNKESEKISSGGGSDDLMESDTTMQNPVMRTTEDAYVFSTGLNYSYTNYQNNEITENTDMLYFIGDIAFSYMVDKSMMINDMKNNNLILLDESAGTAFVTENSQTVGSSETGMSSLFAKTGNTREIIGKPCEEYAYSYEGAKITFWASTEAVLDPGKLNLYKQFEKQFFAGFLTGGTNSSGLVMEINQFDASGNLIFQMALKEITTVEKRVDMSKVSISSY